MYQTDPPRPPKEILPTMYDLPSEDPQEPGLPDEFHIFQPQLLRETFCPPSYPADDVFVASDLNLYYSNRSRKPTPKRCGTGSCYKSGNPPIALPS